MRWCLTRRKNNTKPEKLELKSNVPFHYEAGLHSQQAPIRAQVPANSLPTSPLESRRSLDTRVPIDRRHSLDPQTLDVNMYSREKSESMGSLPYLGLGQLCFDVHYGRKTETLHVKVLSLAQLQQKYTTSQLFVKVALLPDKKRRFQTKASKETDPEFNEEFFFMAPIDEVMSRTLRMTVCTFDRFSRQSTIGYVVFPLTDAKEDLVMEGGTGEIWREITKEDLIVSIAFSVPITCMMHVKCLTANLLTVGFSCYHPLSQNAVVQYGTSLVSSGDTLIEQRIRLDMPTGEFAIRNCK